MKQSAFFLNLGIMQHDKHSTQFEVNAAIPPHIPSNQSNGVRLSNGGDSWNHTSIPLSILTNTAGSSKPDGASLSKVDQLHGGFEANDTSSCYSSQNSKNGCLTLKEHDYIGMPSDSSGSSAFQPNCYATPMTKEKFALALDCKETELRLGIGPPQASQAVGGISGAQSLQAEATQDIAAGGNEANTRAGHESRTSLTEKTGKDISGFQSDVEQQTKPEARSFPKKNQPFSSINNKGEPIVEMADDARPFHNQDNFQGWGGSRFAQAHRGFVQVLDGTEKFASHEVYHLVKEQPWEPHNMAIQYGSPQDKSFITQTAEAARQDILKQAISQHRGIPAGQDVQGSSNQQAALPKSQSGALDSCFQHAYDLPAPADKSSFDAVAAKQTYWQAQISRPFEGFWAPSNQDASRSTNAPEHEAGKGNSSALSGARIAVPLSKSTVPAKRGYLEALGSMDHRIGPGDGKANLVLMGSAPFPGGKVQGGQGVTPGEGFTNVQGTRLHSAHVTYPWWNAIQLPAVWKMGVEQPEGAFGVTPPCNPAGEAFSWKSKGSSCEPSSRSKESQMKTQTHDDDYQREDGGNASSRATVVGWPPIRSFRKNTLASHPKPNAEEQDPQPAPSDSPETSSSKLFVKANMDGVPIGRKLDLKAYDSYESLKLALQDMFQQFISGHNGGQVVSGNQTSTMDSKQLNLLQGSDYVLTHEDKDGDWMLVGDVPWKMFVSTVRRLRIMKSSDAAGLGGQRLSSKET